MKRYDSYKDSGVDWIGDIPSEWECIRLGMLGDFSSSGIDKKSKENETQVRMVNYTDLIQSRKYYPIQTGEKEYMRVTTPQSKLEEHRLKKGDMVFIPSSETHEDLGYSSLIDFDEEDIVYSYHILRYKIKKSIYHYYKKYLINHHSVLNQFSSECKGTTRQIIGRDVFNNVRVVLPPLNEQQQIVEFLDTKTELIDSLIEKTERKIELLKEKRTSLINETVTKGLNPNVEMKDSGVEWIGMIPNHWDFIKIGFISKLLTGNPWKSDLFDFDEGVKILRGENVSEGFLRWGKRTRYSKEKVDVDSKFFVCSGDIIIPMDGSKVGKNFVRIKEEDLPILLHQRMSRIRLNKGYLPKYIEYFIGSDMFQYYITISKTDPMIPHITQKNIYDFYVSIPKSTEQQQIVEYLDEQTGLIDKTISNEENRIELLKEYRQSLISEVVTGKRKVTNG